MPRADPTRRRADFTQRELRAQPGECGGEAVAQPALHGRRLDHQAPERLRDEAVRHEHDEGHRHENRTQHQRFKHRPSAVLLDELRPERQVSPKQFASSMRLRQAVLLHRPGMSLTVLAQESGFYDQSHFSRAIKRATGLPPSTVFEPDRYC